MPVVSDNRPVESDNMPVESDNTPVESDNMPVDSDNMSIHVIAEQVSSLFMSLITRKVLVRNSFGMTTLSKILFQLTRTTEMPL